jgi:hypothetical protein
VPHGSWVGVQRRKSCESLRYGLARGDREWSLDDGHIPNARGVRRALGTGYNRGEGIRRASRNGRVSSSPEIPNVTIRNFFIALWHRARHA